MWSWRMEISWTDRVTNEEVLHRVKNDRNITHTILKRLISLVTSCVEIVFYNALLKEGQKEE
jgi:hypothetical protein